MDIPTIFIQHLARDGPEFVTVYSYHESELTESILTRFLSTVTNGRVGLSATYGLQQALTSIAFASNEDALVVQMDTMDRSRLCPHHTLKRRNLLKTHILTNSSIQKYAFHMDILSTSLFWDVYLRINKAMDILSSQRGDRHLLQTKLMAMGGPDNVNEEAVAELFSLGETSMAPLSVIALQAWAAFYASSIAPLRPISPIDTEKISMQHMEFVAKSIRDAERLRALKPLEVKNEIEAEYSLEEKDLLVKSSRFKTKLKRLGTAQTLQIEVEDSTGTTTKQSANLSSVTGRSARLNLRGGFDSQNKFNIRTIGREDPTPPEALRTNILVDILQGKSSLLEHPFASEIWFQKEAEEPQSLLFQPAIPFSLYTQSLNTAQKQAVNAILSNQSSDRIVMIQGPPGTGKTTIIGAAVINIMISPDESRTVWLCAQSNVAVKNIAEKLGELGFLDFKLLVSKDFHFDWHEHLYEKIEENVIRSDNFPQNPVAAERLLLGSRVILCTLSMLSNDRIATFASIVPPTLFIFDEASQIEVGDFIPVLYRFQKTIQKMVFIGDDKQLPPYGQGDVSELQSVFEIFHLRQRAIFLDTQYRLPHPIGNLISREVYSGRLHTVHPIMKNNCCRFVNVNISAEQKMGSSWINKEEAAIVVALSAQLSQLGCRHRIITPYDAQRSLLENSLKSRNFDWKDKVFNVDSFQGNEEDYIIVSIVRTTKIGMGMWICTSAAFLNGAASKSLVTSLARSLGPDAWIYWKTVIQTDFCPVIIQ